MTELIVHGAVSARASVNIALIKYWGKARSRGRADANMPAVPSLSLTLDKLWTETVVSLDGEAAEDEVCLNNVRLTGSSRDPSSAMLSHIREMAGITARFRVESTNHVPTAAGLASSASGMAALAGAASRCAGLELSEEQLSELARLGSGSAARSIYGGWASWEGRFAVPLAPADHWDVSLVIAVIDDGVKMHSSRDAMNHTAMTSPFYGAWVDDAQALFLGAREAVVTRDLEALVTRMELSTLRMHACAMAANPAVLYWQPASLSAIQRVQTLRQEGVLCGWTMDAGPNVKVLCARDDEAAVSSALVGCPGVARTVVCHPGRGIAIEVL